MKITHVNPDSMLKNPAFSQAVVIADARKWVYIGEQNGVDASGALAGDDLASQTKQAYRNVLELLKAVGATQENVVKLTVIVAKGQDMGEGLAAAQSVWGTHATAVTVNIVEGLAFPGALVGVEAVCALEA